MGSPPSIGGTVATRTVGSVVVVVHSPLPPTTAEWQHVIDIYRNHPNVEVVRVLVYTEGGSPTAAQRADLTTAVSNRKMQVAVVTASVLARAAGTAIAWLIPGLRIFSPSDFEKALDHNSVTGGDRRIIRDTVEQLRRDLTTTSASPSSGAG
jgi:hypothetical protein